MKILIIAPLYHPNNVGGGQISVKTIAEALLEAGHQVVALAISGQKGLTSEYVDGIKVWRAGYRNVYWHASLIKERPSKLQKLAWHILDVFNPFMTGYIKKTIAVENPDVIQIHGSTGWSANLFRVAKKSGIPTIKVLHAYSMLCPGKLYRNDKRCTTQCAECKVFRILHKHYSSDIDAVVGISEAVLQNALKFGYFSKVKLKTVIYNARDPEQLGLVGKSSARESWIDTPANLDVAYPSEVARNPTITRFGYLGNISPVKGVELLLKAFTSLARQDAELWIAGMGEREYIEDLNQRFASEKIRFVGKAHPSKFFRDIDVAVVPSLWDEPLGVVVFEALAFGCPVVGSNRGGIPEMIQEGINGFVFDPDDADQLTNILKRLSDDPELRKRLASQSAKTVEKFLSTTRIARDYSNLYARMEAKAETVPTEGSLVTD